MIDYAYEMRQQFIANVEREGKLRAARSHLGDRHVCHPDNRVKRLARPLEAHTTDVTRTFARVVKQGKDLA